MVVSLVILDHSTLGGFGCDEPLMWKVWVTGQAFSRCNRLQPSFDSCPAFRCPFTTPSFLSFVVFQDKVPRVFYVFHVSVVLLATFFSSSSFLQQLAGFQQSNTHLNAAVLIYSPTHNRKLLASRSLFSSPKLRDFIYSIPHASDP